MFQIVTVLGKACLHSGGNSSAAASLELEAVVTISAVQNISVAHVAAAQTIEEQIIDVDAAGVVH